MTSIFDTPFNIRIISVPYKITSPFGPRLHPVKKIKHLHSGIDLGTGGKPGAELYAPLPGNITFSGEQNGYGYCIEIVHSQEPFFATFWAHLSERKVKVGDKVNKGKLIGLTGGLKNATGSGTSTGPHLHFEVRLQGRKKVDPYFYLFGKKSESDNVPSTFNQFLPNILPQETVVSTSEEETELPLEDIQSIVEVKQELAPGIWQIIKLIIDPEVEWYKLNDLTFSSYQGSLFSFFQKVCQKPFVEFWGDTYGDQYYFIVRKPPFTEKAFKDLALIGRNKLTITDNEVYSDSLSWNNDEIFSWFQLIPSINYIGNSAEPFDQIPAVFFSEYAELWGSRPLSVMNPYITFYREDGKIQLERAKDDLKFLVDTHSYLPFTRKGTITIHGDRRIKRGMVVYYQPTDEYYYVESVSQSFQATEGMLDRITTLQVSHGMSADHVDIDIQDSTTKSYFNLISYGDKNKEANKIKAEPKDDNVTIKNIIAIFNNNEYTWSINNIEEAHDMSTNLDAVSSGKEFKLLKSDVAQNNQNINDFIEFAYKRKNLKFKVYGKTDFNNSNEYNKVLGLKRSETVVATIIDRYENKFGVDDIIDRLEAFTVGEENPNENNSTKLGRLQNRRVEIYISDQDPYTKNNTVVASNKNQTSKNNAEANNNKNKKEDNSLFGDMNWFVNKEVFTFFLRRQQMFKRNKNF